MVDVAAGAERPKLELPELWPSLEDLSGRIAVVTGAGRGLGYGIAVGLAHRGAPVVAAGRDPRGLEETATAVHVIGGQCLAVEADVRKVEDCYRLIDRAVEAFGR